MLLLQYIQIHMHYGTKQSNEIGAENKTWDSKGKAWVWKVHGLCPSTLREQEAEELGERENMN